VSEELKRRVLTLSTRAWDTQMTWPQVESWLSNFEGDFGDRASERLHALHLLTQSTVFGQNLIREMLRTVYTQLFRYPLISNIRKANSDSLDSVLIEAAFAGELSATRFLGVGNPSESGPHLLYYFRQVNKLKKDLFVESAEVISISRDVNGQPEVQIFNPQIKRYVFIDDVLGSATQIRSYMQGWLAEIRRGVPDVEIHYFSLFATTGGLDAARAPELFGGNVECVFELDDSFKCFDKNARSFAKPPSGVDQSFAKIVADGYGERLFPKHPLGYKDGQLLLSLFHNTPDNSLPILWFDEKEKACWTPIFPRYQKLE